LLLYPLEWQQCTTWTQNYPYLIPTLGKRKRECSQHQTQIAVPPVLSVEYSQEYCSINLIRLPFQPLLGSPSWSLWAMSRHQSAPGSQLQGMDATKKTSWATSQSETGDMWRDSEESDRTSEKFTPRLLANCGCGAPLCNTPSPRLLFMDVDRQKSWFKMAKPSIRLLCCQNC
jgi:hypothetical protein